MRHKSDSGDWYGIHEVYYDDAGKSRAWTVHAQEPFGETVDELISSLKMMLAAAQKSRDDVIDYDSKPECLDLLEN